MILFFLSHHLYNAPFFFVIFLVILSSFLLTYRYCLYENLENLNNTNDTKFYQHSYYDVQFHDSVETIESKNTDGSWIINKGKVEYVPWSKIPSIFMYSLNPKPNYIPSYIDSILFRKQQTPNNPNKKLILF